jgi:hypothetical protein
VARLQQLDRKASFLDAGLVTNRAVQSPIARAIIAVAIAAILLALLVVGNPTS